MDATPADPAPWTSPVWLPPAWLDGRLISDSRFAKAYDALGDQRRALLKSLIAAHYELRPPRPALSVETTERFASGLVRRMCETPRPFVLLCSDGSLDAPALLLAALMPALSSRAAEVLVLRLGAKAAVPGPLLAACELAGQERVAALGPAQLERLLLDCAASGSPGLIIHPDTPVMRRLLARPALRPALRAALDASNVRLAVLALPRSLGLWRDLPTQFPAEDLSLLYGDAPFDAGIDQASAKRGARAQKAPPDAEGADFAAFCARPRDLLLVPEARLLTAQGRAAVVVTEAHPGLFSWPELPTSLFTHAFFTYSRAASSAS